jgi:hypothetical protein
VFEQIKEEEMNKPSLSTNMTVFLAFFGVSLLDAMFSGNLIRAAFWLAVGLFFAAAHRFRHRA